MICFLLPSGVHNSQIYPSVQGKPTGPANIIEQNIAPQSTPNREHSFMCYIAHVEYIPTVSLWLVLLRLYKWMNPVTYLFIFVRNVSYSLGRVYGCPSTSQLTLKDMSKMDRHITTIYKHNQFWTYCIIPGMYCIRNKTLRINRRRLRNINTRCDFQMPVSLADNNSCQQAETLKSILLKVANTMPFGKRMHPFTFHCVVLRMMTTKYADAFHTTGPLCGVSISGFL